MSVAHLLNRTSTVWRRTETTDGGGGAVFSWADQGTVQVRFSRPSPAERQTAAQEGVEITHDVYLGADADVRRGDRLVDGGLTVEVVSVVSPSVASHHRKAMAREEPWDQPIE